MAAYLSPEAEKAQLAAAARGRIRAIRMDRGPYLDNDGDLVRVPSDVYRPEIAAFWKAQGFRFDRDNREWYRDTNRPAGDGRTYSPSAWLAAARKEYDRLWAEARAEAAQRRDTALPAARSRGRDKLFKT